jgi:8-oxo-dGTP pyrophosphatase MutT (NUDIX family)
MADPPALSRIEILEDHSPGGDRFLILHRYVVRNHYADGSVSRPYQIDFIDRVGLDSVAVTLYYRDNDRLMVCIRQGIRAAVWFRRRQARPLGDEQPYLLPWEAVAGSVEPGESGLEALKRRACAEALEEAGCGIKPEDCLYLGSILPSHGQSSERIYLFAAEIDPATRKPPAGDGSVNESAAPPPVWLPSEKILSMCRAGEIEDPKIEVGLRRVLEKMTTKE